MPDNQVGVDGDVVPLWMDIWSTDYKDVSPADGIDDDLGQITLDFPSNVKIWRPALEGTGWVPMESGDSIDLNAWYDQGRSDAWYWGWAPGLLVEGLSTSSGLHGTNISATFSKGEAGDATDTVRFTIIQTDADVDSDNNNGTDAPDRNADEDSIESQYDYEEPTYPGKVLAVNDDDTDGDGIPDFADGFNFDNNTSDTLHQLDDQVVAEHFTPLVLDLPSPINTSTARVYLSYNGSAPIGVTKTTNATTGVSTYTPEYGSMRLWLSDVVSLREPAARRKDQRQSISSLHATRFYRCNQQRPIAAHRSNFGKDAYLLAIR